MTQTQRRRVFREAARRRWVAVGVAIPHDTEDLRQAIKREVWTRGLTLAEVAERMEMTMPFLVRLVGSKGQQRITPCQLNKIIAAIHITPAVARRLHLLAAREAGWRV